MGVVNAEPCRADMFIRRYPIEEIDTSSKETMSNWLIELFKQKVASFHNCNLGLMFNLYEIIIYKCLQNDN